MPIPSVVRNASPSIPGISDSVQVAGGTFVFVSGAVALSPTGSADQSFGDEAEACFAELDRALRNAGATFADVVKLTTYVVGLDSAKVSDFRQARDRWVNADALPASTLVGVAALFSDRCSIEIEAIAVL